MPFLCFCGGPQRIPLNMLACDFGPGMWRLYRIWAVARMTGCWPLPVLGGGVLPLLLPECAHCKEKLVDIAHRLYECTGCAALRYSLSVRSRLSASWGRTHFLVELFRGSQVGSELHAYVTYVGNCLLPGLSRAAAGLGAQDWDSDTELASVDSLGE